MKKEIFAGFSMGALIGVIIGLSIAQVTGIVLGAFTSLLAAFFGLKEDGRSEPGNRMIIGTFCISCLLSIFLGLYVRTHDLLSPSIPSEVDAYAKTGLFNRQEMKQIILYKELGIVSKDVKVDNKKNSYQSSVLMSGSDGTLHLCIPPGSSLDDVKNAFIQSGPSFSEIANKILLIPDTLQQHRTFLLIRDCLCNTKN
jgi:hypothetical protein